MPANAGFRYMIYETTVFRCRPLFCFKTRIRSYEVRITKKNRVGIVIFAKRNWQQKRKTTSKRDAKILLKYASKYSTPQWGVYRLPPVTIIGVVSPR